MSDTGNYGPRLAALIDSRRGKTSVRQFAMAAGLDHSRISTWARGATPTLENLRVVADALSMPLGELLIFIGAGTAEDFTVSGSSTATVRDAVELGIGLTETDQKMLRDFLRMLDTWHEGNDSVTVQNRTSAQKRTSRNP